MLEDILTVEESSLVDAGSAGEVLGGRVAFQTGMQDEFTLEIERLTCRRVTAFLSANQTTPGIACELFFLEAPPAAKACEGGRRRAHRLARAVARDVSAEHIVQEAFLSVWRSRAEFRAELGSVTAWVMCTAPQDPR